MRAVLLILALAFSVAAQTAGWTPFASSDRETFSYKPEAVRGRTVTWVRVTDPTDDVLLKQLRYELSCAASTLRMVYSVTYYGLDTPVGRPARRVRLASPSVLDPDRPRFVSPAPGSMGRKLLSVICEAKSGKNVPS